MKTFLIIDTKLVSYYLWHRQHPILEGLSLIANLSMSNLQRFSNIIPVFVMDKGRSKRVDIFPQYKAHRKALIEKKGESYISKQKQLEKDYQAMENLYRIYGKTLNIKGLEADDLASIIGNAYGKDNNIIFATSDSDWVKFMENENFYMLHINRKKLIRYNQMLEEFKVPSPDFKLLKDVFCGVGKENVSGLKKLGEKTFLKITDNGKILDIEEIKKQCEFLLEKNRIQLPDDVSNLNELIERNLKLFKPMTHKDITIEEKEEIQKQWKMVSSRSLDDIYNVSAEFFNTIHIPTTNEKIFFNLR